MCVPGMSGVHRAARMSGATSNEIDPSVPIRLDVIPALHLPRGKFRPGTQRRELSERRQGQTSRKAVHSPVLIRPTFLRFAKLGGAG